MANSTTTNPADLALDSIEFIEYHQPGLATGNYQISVTQTVSTIDGKIPTATFSLGTQNFTIAGESLTFNPQVIESVFPPAGSLGDYSNVLPHIIFNRSTIPWERQPIPGSTNDQKKIPWLALLLFEEEEKPIPQVVTLTELNRTAANLAKFSTIPLEAGQKEEDRVTIIDVNKKLLQTLLPNLNDLTLMAHVRRSIDFTIDDAILTSLKTAGIPDEILQKLTELKGRSFDEKTSFEAILKTTIGGAIDEYRDLIEQLAQNPIEIATVIGNRLPKKNGTNTVHLVSLSARYPQGEFKDLIDATDTELIRLISLYSWSFTCLDDRQNFQGLLKNLNRNPSTLRLPKSIDPAAEKYLSNGYIPLPHFLRQGEKTYSWYHSPLLPGNNSAPEIPLPARAADELIYYNRSNGLFDISYAAAWELGRLLALQSQDFSFSLYNWKQSHSQALKAIEQSLIHSHLPFQAVQNVEVPNSIATWFKQTSLLQGVPFNYLVPDERMLPPESIRFFWVDPLWIDCLLDGAFSIGRVTSEHHRVDRDRANIAANLHPHLTGCLIRSDVVAGWPSLLVDGYKDAIANAEFIPDSERLPLLRMERLSSHILLCLFAGEVQTIDIHQKPETLHFGVDLSTENDRLLFSKRLRNSQGEKIDPGVAIPWQTESQRIIDIAGLAASIQQRLGQSNHLFTAAQFALETIAGVEKIRFVIH